MALQTFVGHEVVECINKSKSGGRKKGKKNRVKKLHWNVYRISAFQFDVGFAHRCHTHNFHWLNISWPFIQSTLQSRTQCYLRKHSHNILNCFFLCLQLTVSKKDIVLLFSNEVFAVVCVYFAFMGQRDAHSLGRNRKIEMLRTHTCWAGFKYTPYEHLYLTFVRTVWFEAQNTKSPWHSICSRIFITIVEFRFEFQSFLHLIFFYILITWYIEQLKQCQQQLSPSTYFFAWPFSHGKLHTDSGGFGWWDLNCTSAVVLPMLLVIVVFVRLYV